MKNVNLATTENITTTYAGQDTGKYVRAALLASESLNNGAVSVLPNVKYQAVLHKLDLSGLIQDDSCEFSDEGTSTLAERILTMERFKVNLELCKDNYRNTWEAESMGASAHDELPPKFADYFIESVIANIADANETILWSGVNATAGQYDGFEVLMANQSTQPAAFELSGTTVTASNVVAQIQSILEIATATAVYKSPGFAIRIPTQIAMHYRAAQAALGYRDLYNANGDFPLMFQGVPLIECPGMTNDVMIATYSDNLWFGTNVMADYNEVKVLDMADRTGDDSVRFIMKYAAGCQIANPEDVITYGITNSGN